MVAVFRSLRGEGLEDYSVRLAQAWRIGQKGLDNGVVFLVFLDDRKMRIEVGYGLEATLTDAIAASIIREVVAPRFREGRLADGIDAGIEAIGAALAGTYRGPPSGRSAGWRGLPLDAGTTIWLVILAVIVAQVLFFALARSRGDRRRGFTGGRHGWDVGPIVGSGWGSGRGSGWSFGGGGGSSSGGSGGGFSGGGGSFGGGGASGSW